MIIGAHVSAAGGLTNAITNAKKLKLDAIQIFASPPSNWNPPKASLEEAAAFGEACRQNDLDYTFLHAIYLINLASANPELVAKSKESLINYMNINAAIKGNGVIFHVGSTRGQDFQAIKPQIINLLNEIISQSNPPSTLIIETNAGSGDSIGDTFEEIAQLITGIKDKSRIGVCLDTAHIFASGYDIVNQYPSHVIDEFDRIIGLQYLKAIHANDSKSAYNSHVDRHENIGQGKIGEEPFRQLLHLSALQNIPFILEVPGFDNHGPDEPNVHKLRQLSTP